MEVMSQNTEMEIPIANVKVEPEEIVLEDDEGMPDDEHAQDAQADEPKEETEAGKSKDEAQAKENGEQSSGKRAIVRPLIVSLKERIERLMDLTEPSLEGNEDVSDICSETRKIKQLAEDVISLAMKVGKKRKLAAECQYVAKIQGLRPQHFKDMRNVLQNALGLGTLKISSLVRNSPFVDVHFFSEEVMDKAIRIIRGKPLGLSLSVVETKMVEKARLPPEWVLKPLDKEYDATIMLKESLLRSRELTEEEFNKMLEWKDKFIKHMLLKMCETLDPDIFTVIKDRTEGYLYKLEKIKATTPLDSESERYQTYSGVNSETDKVEMGYWVLGSDVPSRLPRSKCIRESLKVLTDFMESSGKPFYDLRVRKGYWDSVMFRSNHEGQCMVLLIVRSGDEANPEKTCEELKPQLLELFENGPGKDCGVKSIHMKILGESGRSGNWHLMYGDEFLDEEIAGVKLRLYMNSLFWSDSGCMEVLCESIADELGLDEETGVLELGVATGLICMYLAKRCKVVCGLDRLQTVLPLAEKNVELNELKNIVLVHGTPSTTLTSLKPHFKECENVYAFIMETSSTSRNKDEVVGMRKALWIKKVAYLIISYKDVTATLRQLCSKHVDSSEPFVMVKALPFDTASASFRPDVLILLERASALDDRTEKRVPKTKPKVSTSPAAKRARLSDGPRPRSLLAGKKLRPPLMREPGMSEGRGYMGRGFSQNPNRGPPRGGSFWIQGDDTRRPLLSFDASEPIARMRAVEEAEARLAERMRMQKEEQLQQLQEVVMQAQRRHLADALLPTPPPVANIEEVVLSAIKKTGLLQKVAALTDMPQKSRMDMDTSRDTNWSRFNERQSPDRWQSGSYRQRGSGKMTTGIPGTWRRGSAATATTGHDNTNDSRTSRDRYDSRNSQDYRDRGSYGYGNRDLSPEPRGRGSSRYQGRGSFGFQDRGSSGGTGSSYKSRGSYYN